MAELRRRFPNPFEGTSLDTRAWAVVCGFSWPALSLGERMATAGKLALALSFTLMGALLVASHNSAIGQIVDCQRLQAQIAAPDDPAAVRPNRYSVAAQRQRIELDRTVRYARSLGCDQQQLPFFGRPQPAQCPGLDAKIRQMEANLAQLQTAAAQGDRAYVKQDLVARYNALCRGQLQADVTQPLRGFFESLFGAGAPPAQPSAVPPVPYQDEVPRTEGDEAPRGGSQAVCVRSCDGGFFPLDLPARADPERLTQLCRALCPNADATVYTKSPFKEIKTAVSLEDGEPYTDMANALKFQRSFDPACACKAPHQSWVDALAGAEALLGEERRGDITVTQEKADELSRPRSSGIIAAQPARPSAERRRGETAASKSAAEPDLGRSETKETTSPDGIKRRVRIVGPTL